MMFVDVDLEPETIVEQTLVIHAVVEYVNHVVLPVKTIEEIAYQQEKVEI